VICHVLAVGIQVWISRFPTPLGHGIDLLQLGVYAGQATIAISCSFVSASILRATFHGGGNMLYKILPICIGSVVFIVDLWLYPSILPG
jgi:hypothetical protein